MALHDLFIAVFEKAGGPAWHARHGLDGGGYQQAFEQSAAQGMRVRTAGGYASNGAPHFAALWVKGAGPAWHARHGLDGAAYQATFDQLVAQGFRLTFVNGYGVGGKDFYTALWEQRGGGAWEARHGLDGPAYQAKFDRLTKEGYRPRWISAYAAGGRDRYAALWEKTAGPAWVARHGLTAEALRAVSTDLAAQGFRPTVLSACNAGGRDLFAGFWEKDGGPPVEVHAGMTGDTYQQVFDRLVGAGWRLKHVHGYAGAEVLDVALRFTMQAQQQSNWCWAATSVSLRRYYQPASTLTQCALVDQRRGRSDCCASGGSDACNQPDNTAEVIQSLGHLRSVQSSAATRQQLLTELVAGRPVALRVRWGSAAVGHALVVDGMDEGDLVTVADPWFGDSVVDYDVMLGTYQSNGTWGSTYYTEA